MLWWGGVAGGACVFQPTAEEQNAPPTGCRCLNANVYARSDVGDTKINAAHHVHVG